MTPQSSIAHYRIISKLGEGGMGAVYRAIDTKLNREVAIKVLPDALANDPDYVARFTREAQVLASLNHPNIAIIHGVEERALVMELVEGPTLAERIAAGPLTLDEALRIALQVAEALEAAHEKGVIHRDLKPANVKVTPEGVVKVLDFGLAKAADPVAGSSINSPTLTIRATQAGLIMGTAGYMAPEQAAGKPVDRRADIWSFGVVLYELLTARRLFTGETISHTLASVLKDPIDFRIPQVPPPICRLLARCLTRDPKERLRDIGEARIAIRSYLTNPQPEGELETSVLPARRPGLRYWVPRTVFAILFLALAAALAWIFRPSPPPTITRFSVTLGEGQVFTNAGRSSLAISPDGTQIAYVANRRLYLRSLSELEARPIPGTESSIAVTNPAFSPDGKALVFFDGYSRSLKRIATSGGAATTICPIANPVGVSWGPDGIVFAAAGKGILRVSSNGGQPETLVVEKPNELLADPQILPDGHTILFSIWNGRLTFARDRAQIVAQTSKSGARKILVPEGSNGCYLPTGHVVYYLNGVLFSAPFNLRRLEMAGAAAALVEGVERIGTGAQFAVSKSGTLAYIPGPVTASGVGHNVLALVDRKGEAQPLKVPPGEYSYPRVSKDGKRVAYQSEDEKESSIWIWELTGETAPRRLTLPGTGANRYPIWSSDGRRVAFQSDREGDPAIWWQLADGSGAAERLTKPGKDAADIPDSWSPDGQTFSFTKVKGNASEVWTYSLRDRKDLVFAATPGASLSKSVFSPDGRWVAYQSDAMPNSRIYVRPFPSTATVYVAPEDADSHHPVWSPDGKELFYVPGPGQLGSMSISTQPSVSFGSPIRAPTSGFTTAVPTTVRTYDMLPDGKHFIGVVPSGVGQSGATGPPRIQVVLNWFEDVKQRAGRD